MLKLIRAYQINPSLKNARRLLDYVRTHPEHKAKLAENEANSLAHAILHANRWRGDRFTVEA